MGPYQPVKGLGIESWTCDRCGAVVIEDTMERHDEFHDLINGLSRKPTE